MADEQDDEGEWSHPQSQMEDITGRFVRSDKKLGNGTIKLVYQARDEEEGVDVAWNELDTTRATPAALEKFKNEIAILEGLEHANVLKCTTHFTEGNKLVFITEMMPGGTLKTFISQAKNHRLKLRVTQKICRQLVKALEYLHAQQPPVIHSNLMCENIFIDAHNCEVKLGDFGLSGRLGTVSSFGHRLEFMAPEIMATNGLCTCKGDVYSFGMCVLEMVSGQLPYAEYHGDTEQIRRQVEAGVPPEALDRVPAEEYCVRDGATSSTARAFIVACLAPVDNRPTSSELATHTFIVARIPPELHSVVPLYADKGPGTSVCSSTSHSPSLSATSQWQHPPSPCPHSPVPLTLPPLVTPPRSPTSHGVSPHAPASPEQGYDHATPGTCYAESSTCTLGQDYSWGTFPNSQHHFSQYSMDEAGSAYAPSVGRRTSWEKFKGVPRLPTEFSSAGEGIDRSLSSDLESPQNDRACDQEAPRACDEDSLPRGPSVTSSGQPSPTPLVPGGPFCGKDTVPHLTQLCCETGIGLDIQRLLDEEKDVLECLRQLERIYTSKQEARRDKLKKLEEDLVRHGLGVAVNHAPKPPARSLGSDVGHLPLTSPLPPPPESGKGRTYSSEADCWDVASPPPGVRPKKAAIIGRMSPVAPASPLDESSPPTPTPQPNGAAPFPDHAPRAAKPSSCCNIDANSLMQDALQHLDASFGKASPLGPPTIVRPKSLALPKTPLSTLTGTNWGS